MRIRREDVDLVRERTRIEEVVGEYVALRSAGVGSMKGLCPFHDEKTPSFHVRPPVGLWHCFGCDQGGDVYSFVQQVDHLTFAEAVERLAARIGHQLQYEDDAGGRAQPRRDEVGRRQRLLEANRAAAAFYAEQLSTSPDAIAGRQFLSERGFDRAAAEHFGVGFAPRSGEALLRHLRGRAFTDDELVAAGVAGQGQRGPYDRFRGRLLWPIRDVAGDVVGFGARRLFDDDRVEAKYLNTSETTLYKKSQVLYGVDLAKKAIGRERQVVVVEGYTDVMACHLSGVETAVATCGTAFGADHVRIVRRLLGDDRTLGADGRLGGQVIFTFDGDAAGQKAAVRAFDEDQRFVAQTYVAVAADGMDPCELRLSRGEPAVRALLTTRTPLFEFVIRSTLGHLDLDTAEGRVAGLRSAAGVVAKIKDAALRQEYARLVAGWVGTDESTARSAVSRAARQGDGSGSGPGQRGGPGERGAGDRGGADRGGGDRGAGDRGERSSGAAARPSGRLDPRDPVTRLEREALECMLQLPSALTDGDADQLPETAFEMPSFRAIRQGIVAAGGMAAAGAMPVAEWVGAVREQVGLALSDLVTELAVTPLPVPSADAVGTYATSVVLRLAELDASRAVGAARSRMQRLAVTDPGYNEAFAELLAIEARHRALRDRLGGT